MAMLFTAFYDSLKLSQLKFTVTYREEPCEISIVFDSMAIAINDNKLLQFESFLPSFYGFSSRHDFFFWSKSLFNGLP